MGFHVACGLGSYYACGLDCQYTACLLLVVFDREAGRYDRHDETEAVWRGWFVWLVSLEARQPVYFNRGRS